MKTYFITSSLQKTAQGILVVISNAHLPTMFEHQHLFSSASSLISIFSHQHHHFSSTTSLININIESLQHHLHQITLKDGELRVWICG
jgi:hypothetical protein